MPQDIPLVLASKQLLDPSSLLNNGRNITNATWEMLQSSVFSIALPTLFSIIFTISIPLNSISLWFLCKHSRPWTPTIVFCINLTIADLLYSMLLPFQIVYHSKGNYWPFGDVLCRIVTVLSYGNMHCSVLTMMSISIERYLGIVLPLRYKVMRSIRTSVLACIIIWVLVVTICYLPHIVIAVIHYVLLADDKTFYVAYKLSLATAGFNCCFDPLVYYYGSKEFRRKIQKKLCRCAVVGFSENTPIFSEHDMQITPIQKAPRI
ncbi:P2Y purinoceptor 8 [Anolis carolinensis]|uniref:P2Y purinoceptor 8 n=1 Tax=Anolis carolinensis TaxID=28377 RepID=UPI002F2B56AC